MGSVPIIRGIAGVGGDTTRKVVPTHNAGAKVGVVVIHTRINDSPHNACAIVAQIGQMVVVACERNACPAVIASDDLAGHFIV